MICSHMLSAVCILTLLISKWREKGWKKAAQIPRCVGKEWLHRLGCYSSGKIWSRWDIIRDYKIRSDMHRATKEELLSASLSWGAAMRLTGLKKEEKN